MRDAIPTMNQREEGREKRLMTFLKKKKERNQNVTKFFKGKLIKIKLRLNFWLFQKNASAKSSSRDQRPDSKTSQLE